MGKAEADNLNQIGLRENSIDLEPGHSSFERLKKDSKTLKVVVDIAKQLEPEIIDGMHGGENGHEWCLEASVEIRDALEDAGYLTRDLHDQDYGRFWDPDLFHTWVELEDGTIIDATYGQFTLEETFASQGLSFDNYQKHCRQLGFDAQTSEDFLLIGPDDPRRALYYYATPGGSRRETLFASALDNPSGDPFLENNNFDPNDLKLTNLNHSSDEWSDIHQQILNILNS
jgi:hypothetical protein